MQGISDSDRLTNLSKPEVSLIQAGLSVHVQDKNKNLGRRSFYK